MEILVDKNFIEGKIKIYKTDKNRDSVLVSETKNKVYSDMFNNFSNSFTVPNFYINLWKDNIDKWDTFTEPVENVLSDWKYLTRNDKYVRAGIYPAIASKDDILPVMPKHIFHYGYTDHAYKSYITLAKDFGDFKAGDLFFSESFTLDKVNKFPNKYPSNNPQSQWNDLYNFQVYRELPQIYSTATEKIGVEKINLSSYITTINGKTIKDPTALISQLRAKYDAINVPYSYRKSKIDYLFHELWRNMYYLTGEKKYMVDRVSSNIDSLKYTPKTNAKVIDELTNDNEITLEYTLQINKKFNKSDFPENPEKFKYISLGVDLNGAHEESKKLYLGKSTLQFNNDSLNALSEKTKEANVSLYINSSGVAYNTVTNQSEYSRFDDCVKITADLKRSRAKPLNFEYETDIRYTDPYSYIYNVTTANVNTDEDGNAIGLTLEDSESIDIVYTLTFRVTYPKFKLNVNIEDVIYNVDYQLYNPYYIHNNPYNKNDLIKHIFNISDPYKNTRDNYGHIPKYFDSIDENGNYIKAAGKYTHFTADENYYDIINTEKWKYNILNKSDYNSVKAYSNYYKNNIDYNYGNDYGVDVYKRQNFAIISSYTYKYNENTKSFQKIYDYRDEISGLKYFAREIFTFKETLISSKSFDINYYISDKKRKINFDYDEAMFPIQSIITGLERRSYNLTSYDESSQFKFNQKMYDLITMNMPKLSTPVEYAYNNGNNVSKVVNKVKYGIALYSSDDTNWKTVSFLTIPDYPIYSWVITFDKPLMKKDVYNISLPIPLIKWYRENPDNPNIAKLIDIENTVKNSLTNIKSLHDYEINIVNRLLNSYAELLSEKDLSISVDESKEYSDNALLLSEEAKEISDSINLYAAEYLFQNEDYETAYNLFPNIINANYERLATNKLKLINADLYKYKDGYFQDNDYNPYSLEYLFDNREDIYDDSE